MIARALHVCAHSTSACLATSVSGTCHRPRQVWPTKCDYQDDGEREYDAVGWGQTAAVRAHLLGDVVSKESSGCDEARRIVLRRSDLKRLQYI
jgi:hypothetical protein